jgi:ligand-binding sensor domain-containing protein/two-component sensor histidine kinase
LSNVHIAVLKRKNKSCPTASRLMLAALCLLALACVVRAEHLPVRTYTTADGLVHDQVEKIMQDSHGFIWFCTVDGISRFDGYRFTNYSVKDGLPIARINEMIEAHNGVYWVATNGGGVSRFDPAEDARRVAEARAGGQTEGDVARVFKTYRVGDAAQSNIVETIFEDRAGNVWAGTQGGLFRLAGGREGGAFERVPLNIPAFQEEVANVECLAEDAEGSIWAGTLYGLVRIMPGGRTIHQYVQAAQGTDIVWALTFDRQGRLWVGHQAGLLVVNPEPAARVAGGTDALLWRVVANEPNVEGGRRLQLPDVPGEARKFTTADGMGGNNVQAVEEFADGRVWVGTLGGGVSVFDGGRFRVYAAAHGLANRVSALTEDRDGNVWVGTQGYGAMKVTRGGFISYTETEGLGAGEVVSIFEGPEARVCVVTSKWTVNWFDGEQFKQVRLNLPKQIIESSSGRWQVMRDHAGEWWAATGVGLYRFPAVARIEDLAIATPVAYTTRDGLADDNISRIYEDSRGDIWIGSYNPPVTLAKWERASQTFRRFGETDGMPPFNWANVIGEDATGQVWIGLHNGGLARVRNGRVEVFGESEKVPGGFGQGLYGDKAGRLWVATSRGGVRLEEPSAEDPRVVSFAEPGTLSSDNLRCFVEDKFGRLYICTARGVDRLDFEAGRVKRFTTADGLIKSEVVAAFRDRAGALWFGTREGLSRLFPAPESVRAQSPTPVLIGGLRVAGLAHPVSGLGEAEVPELTLGSEQGQVQVDFFGLSFRAGEDLRYQYMIEGLRREWSAPSEQRSVTASLSPGKYRFLVRAVSSDGTVSARPASVSLNILPPFWRRWWFLTLAALAVGLVVYTVDRNRIRRVVELERVRTRIATDLHDDIGASLSQIAILSEVVSARVGNDGDSPVREPLATIAGTSREMVDSMSDIVWAINPKRDRLSDLAQRMRLFASDILSARDIRIRFNAPETAKDVTVGADLRREIYLIFKETVNNLAKHSGASAAGIDFRLAGSRIVVTVSDNGKGFATDAAGASDDEQHVTMGGHGLGSMRQRAEKLGGTYDVASEMGRGTTVTLKVPIKIKRRRRALAWRRLVPRRLLPK